MIILTGVGNVKPAQGYVKAKPSPAHLLEKPIKCGTDLPASRALLCTSLPVSGAGANMLGCHPTP
jgi:hypothetical protein